MKASVLKQHFQKSKQRMWLLAGSFGLLFVVIVSVFYISIIMPMFAKAYSGVGLGTDQDPYQITTCDQLQEISEDLDAHYVLVQDIDCSATMELNNFEPIAAFSGTLDGRNYAIKDISIVRPSQYYAGIFEWTAGATIKNLSLIKDQTPEGYESIVGGGVVGTLVAEVRGGTIIQNVHNEMNVKVLGYDINTSDETPGIAYAGGLVGLNRGTVYTSSSVGSVTAQVGVVQALRIGGLIGNMADADGGRIEDSYADASVTASSNESEVIGSCGGLVGQIGALGFITRSYSAGTVNCTQQSLRAGGFVGVQAGAGDVDVIESSFSTTSVSGYESGGFVGDSGSDSLTNVYFDVTSSGQTLCGLPDQQLNDCYPVNADGLSPDYFLGTSSGQPLQNFDFIDTWTIVPGQLPQIKPSLVTADPPVNIGAIRAEGSINLSWEAPAVNGVRNSDIDGYVIEYKKNNDTSWSAVELGVPIDQISYAFTDNKIDSSTYHFRIRSHSTVGTSNVPSSEADSIVDAPSTAPELTVLSQTARQVVLGFSEAPRSSDYVFQYKKVADSDWSTALEGVEYTAGENVTIVALDPSTPYEFRALGRNSSGQGPWSTSATATTGAAQQISISDCAGLQAMNNNLEAKYTLTADIDCTATTEWNDGQGFQPIGPNQDSGKDIFSGEFDGAGHAIRNLYINRSFEIDNAARTEGVGLFGTVAYGTIKNVRLSGFVVAATYELDPSIDADRNGLPDSPDLVDYDGANLPLDVLGIYTTFPRVYAGSLVGISIGKNKFSDIQAENVVVSGSVAGGLIGTHAGIFGRDSQFTALGQDISKSTLFVDNLQSTGAVWGTISGGIIGVASAMMGDLEGNEPTLTITNSASSAEVSGNLSGGLVGIGLSTSALLPLGIIDQSEAPTMSFQDVTEKALSSQMLIITNSHATGNVSVCNSPSGVQVGSLGGLIGVGVGVNLENTYATGGTGACTDTTDDLDLYGGAYGGLAGTLVISTVQKSHATGNITLVNDRTDGHSQGGVLAVTGGLVGVIINSGNQNGSIAIDSVYATGSTTVEGVNGLLHIGGGLMGVYLGGGSITKSYATGNILNKTAQQNIGGISIVGGFMGVAVGADVQYMLSAAFTIFSQSALSAVPTQGLVVSDSYATGSVLSNKGDSGGVLLSVHGGFGGLSIGNITYNTIHASGDVGLQHNGEFYVDTGSGGIGQDFFEVVGENNSAVAVGGGLFGMTAGADVTHIVNGFLNIDDKLGDGLAIYNSYASGRVDALISGGLVGAAELRTKISKTYATGDVSGLFVGGLVGESGTLSSVGISVLANLVLGDYTHEIPDQILEGIRHSFEGLVPVELVNTYATGDVRGKEARISLGGFNFTDPAATPIRMSSIAGGLVGLVGGAGSVIKDSYGSGDVSVETLTEQPVDKTKIRFPESPSFIGGIAGVVLAVPQADAEAMRDYFAPDADQSDPAALFPEPMRIERVFSVSKVSIADGVVSGGAFGLFLSPISVAFQDSISVPDGVFYSVSDNYYDKSKIDTSACDGFTNPSDRFRQLWQQFIDRNDREKLEAFYTTSDFGEATIVPSLDTLYDLSSDSWQPAFKPISCTAVNEGNAQPNYFINNKTNAPLNNWDFTNVWRTRPNQYPTFVAGVSTNDPEGPEDPGSPVTPSTPTSSTNTVNPQTRTTVRDILQNLISPNGRLNTNDSRVKGIWTIFANVPPVIAKSIPYLLILMLLFLAAMYARQALREYRQLSEYHNSAVRVASAKDAVNSYLAITTHYLNTPVAIMNGALELLTSLNKISAARADTLRIKLKKFSEDVSRLLAANQVSSAGSVNRSKEVEHPLPSPVTAKAVWVPASVAFALLVIANVIFIFANVFDRSPLRITIEFGLFLLGILLVALSYRYRNYLEQAKILTLEQLTIESSLYKKREAFIPEATKIIGDNFESLSIASQDIKKIPEAKAFFNGLAMLGGVNTGLQNLEKFAHFKTDPPLFDITAAANKAVQEVADRAKAKGVLVTASIASGVITHIEPAEIKHVFDSLLDNAIKFNNQGGKVVMNVAKKYDKLVVSVSDTGVGISEQKLPSLLQPFSRGTDSMQYNYEGVGLSLYATKLIVDKLGGSIIIDSTLGKGTTVTINLPLQYEANVLAPMVVTPQAA